VGPRAGWDMCEISRPHRDFLSRLFPKNSSQKFIFLPCLPYILYISSQGVITTLPDNPWEHILIASPDSPARSQSLYRLNYPAHILHETLCKSMIMSGSILFRIRNILEEFVEKIKTHVLHSITFSRRPCRLRDSAQQYDGLGQATDEITAHSVCMLDN
jgi:hypothetical protein